MPIARDPKEAERAPRPPSSEGGEGEDQHRQTPELEGPPPRDVILLDSIPVGPGKVVDVVVPRDRSVPPPDQTLDPFEPVVPVPERELEAADQALSEAEAGREPEPKGRPRLSDLWRRLLRLWRASSGSG